VRYESEWLCALRCVHKRRNFFSLLGNNNNKNKRHEPLLAFGFCFIIM
jgi:hypothetical protein